MPVYFNWIYWAHWTKPQLLTFYRKWNVRTSFSLFRTQGQHQGDHLYKLLSCQLYNRLLNVQLFSFHTVIVHVGGERSGRNDLAKAECSRLLCLWPLQPQPSRNNTFVNHLEGLGWFNARGCSLSLRWDRSVNSPPSPALQDHDRTKPDLFWMPGWWEPLALRLPGRRCCRDAGPASLPFPLPQVFINKHKLVIKGFLCLGTFLNWHLGPYSSKNSHWFVLEHRLRKPSGTGDIFAAWCSSDAWQFQGNFVTLKQHYRCVFNWP